jgi:predicted Rossmann fold flavoprotein
MKFDAIIIGAGAAGLYCAAQAGNRGRRVLVIDHSPKSGGKILISGGGRCNFTNTGTTPLQYVSKNSHFCKSALSRHLPEAFIEKVKAHGISFHEKKLGQLFCDGSAKQIITLLETECRSANVEFLMGHKVNKVTKETNGGFSVHTGNGHYECTSLVIATGGLSLPKLGASGFGYDIARQFGLTISETAPALDGFVLNDRELKGFSELSGLSVDSTIHCNDYSFRENILFTHTGLSGPGALQASLHWNSGDSIFLDLSPDRNLEQFFLLAKSAGQNQIVKNFLAKAFPARFAEKICEWIFSNANSQVTLTPVRQVSDQNLKDFAAKLHHFEIKPLSTVGYSKAEVTRGGVDTDELSSKTLESKKVPGLYFIGEVVDVTGWLGGYNFQWAWASGWAAGQVI